MENDIFKLINLFRGIFSKNFNINILDDRIEVFYGEKSITVKTHDFLYEVVSVIFYILNCEKQKLNAEDMLSNYLLYTSVNMF